MARARNPETVADHATYSKRAMARDQVAVMEALGFDRFRVAGHDRGGRCAYRLALDHPDRIEKLAVLDIVPTGEAFWRADRAFGMGYWHWFFLAQPHDLPERMIGADPEHFWRTLTGGISAGRDPFAPEALEEYFRWFRDPASIHAMCEDYRAGATIDVEHDAADRDAGRRVVCPLLALWGAKGMLARWYVVLEVWRGWAGDVQGRALDCGHFLPEEAPEQTLAELRAFFAD